LRSTMEPSSETRECQLNSANEITIILLLSRQSLTRSKQSHQSRANLSPDLLPNLNKVCSQLLQDEYCIEQDTDYELESIDFFAFVKKYQQYVKLTTVEDFYNYMKGTNDLAFHPIEAKLKMKSLAPSRQSTCSSEGESSVSYTSRQLKNMKKAAPLKHNVIQSAAKDFTVENCMDYKQPFTMFFGIDNYFDLSNGDLVKYNQYKRELNDKVRSYTRMYVVEKQAQIFLEERSDEVSVTTFWKEYLALTASKSTQALMRGIKSMKSDEQSFAANYNDIRVFTVKLTDELDKDLKKSARKSVKTASK